MLRCPTQPALISVPAIVRSKPALEGFDAPVGQFPAAPLGRGRRRQNDVPAAAGLLPPLRLSKQEAQSFLQWGDSLLQQTIDAYHREQFDTQEMRERKWKPIKQRRDLTVYRRRKIKDDGDYKFLCTGRIDGTLDEVVMGRYADNTPDFRRISGVYRDDIVDCAVLGVIKKRSPEDPFFLSCFKWMTVESPARASSRTATCAGTSRSA